MTAAATPSDFQARCRRWEVSQFGDPDAPEHLVRCWAKLLAGAVVKTCASLGVPKDKVIDAVYEAYRERQTPLQFRDIPTTSDVAIPLIYLALLSEAGGIDMQLAGEAELLRFQSIRRAGDMIRAADPRQDHTVEPSADLYRRVMGGFRSQGTSLTRWCVENQVTRQWAKAVLDGSQTGRAALSLRRVITECALGEGR